MSAILPLIGTEVFIMNVTFKQVIKRPQLIIPIPTLSGLEIGILTLYLARAVYNVCRASSNVATVYLIVFSCIYLYQIIY